MDIEKLLADYDKDSTEYAVIKLNQALGSVVSLLQQNPDELYDQSIAAGQLYYRLTGEKTQFAVNKEVIFSARAKLCMYLSQGIDKPVAEYVSKTLTQAMDAIDPTVSPYW